MREHRHGTRPRSYARTRLLHARQVWQAVAVADAWSHDHDLAYLGDRHSHPDGAPGLSKQDRQALKVIADSTDASSPERS